MVPARRSGDSSSHSLRSRILLAILAISGTAIVGFGIPLGIALSRVEHDRTVLRLEREASQVLAQIPDEKLATIRNAPIPRPIPGTRDADDSAMRIGIYDSTGRLRAGHGPRVSALAAAAVRTAHERIGNESGQVTVALSLNAERPPGFAVRVAMSNSDVAEDSFATWWLMAALAVLVLASAGVIGFLLSRRLIRPLDALSRSARQLGEGDFTVRTSATGVREIDAVNSSLDVTARRLGDLLDRERAFSSNASHQIRTPLAALRLSLETLDVPDGSEVATAIGDAVRQLDRLEATLDHLLSLARDVERPSARIDLDQLLDELESRWAKRVRATGRWLTVDYPKGIPPVAGSAASLSHVLDVLVDNALQHGSGEINVSLRDAGRAVAIDVSDEGDGIRHDVDAIFQRRTTSGGGHGIGLALARSLMEAEGGRLELAVAGPNPVFSVLLPLSSHFGDPTRSPATAAKSS